MTPEPPKHSAPANIAGSLGRILAAAVWAAIALIYLAFFIADLRLDYAQIQVPCSGAECNYLAVSQAEFDVLAAWGLGGRGYALMLITATVLGVAISWSLGLLIFWRQGTTRLGWIVSLVILILPVASIADADNVAAAYPELQTISFLLSVIGLNLLLAFLYLFPSGRFHPRWAASLYIISALFFSILTLSNGGVITLPVDIMPFETVFFIGLIFLPGIFQIHRYRNVATQVERQQTKWTLLGILCLVIGFPTWFLFFGGGLMLAPGLPRLLGSLLGWLAAMSLILMLPISIGVAIQRYRIWDFDLLVRRTLMYALLTGTLALVYFGGVVTLQGILAPFTGEANSPLVTVLSTLAIAALFNPLRSRLQDFIDRRFYRARYDAERALARFAETTRDEVDMGRLNAALLTVVEDTMQPENTSLWVRK